MEVLYCQDKDTKKKIKVTQLNNGIPLDVIKHVHISTQEFFMCSHAMFIEFLL